MKLKSASSGPRVMSSNPRVTSLNPRVASSNPRVTSSNPRFQESVINEKSLKQSENFLVSWGPKSSIVQ